MWWRDLLNRWRKPRRLVVACVPGGPDRRLLATALRHAARALTSIASTTNLLAIEIPPIAATQGHACRTRRGRHVQRAAIRFARRRSRDARRPTGSRSMSEPRNLPRCSTRPPAGRIRRSMRSSPAYQLIEIATGKVVVRTSFSHVDYDIPGSQQRFAGQRAQRDAEDRAIACRRDHQNRLASYFVAGT